MKVRRRLLNLAQLLPSQGAPTRMCEPKQPAIRQPGLLQTQGILSCTGCHGVAGRSLAAVASGASALTRLDAALSRFHMVDGAWQSLSRCGMAVGWSSGPR